MKHFFLFLFFVFAINTFAQKEVNFRIVPSNLNPKNGDTVNYQVITTGFKDIVSLLFELNWDTTALKVISTPTSLFKEGNDIFKKGGASFNVVNNKLIHLYFNYSYGNEVLDSVYFTIKTLVKDDKGNTNICFNANSNIELSKINASENTYNYTYEVKGCNQLIFKYAALQIYVQNDQNIYSYTEKTTLKIYPYNGIPPYSIDWGNEKNVYQISFQNPQKDTIYKVKIWDYNGDTINYTFNLKYIVVPLNVKFEYNELPNNIVRLSAKVQGKTGTFPVTIDWGTIKNVETIEINKTVIDSNYFVKVYDKFDTITKSFFLKSNIVFNYQTTPISSIPFDKASIKIKATVTFSGLMPPYHYNWGTSSSLDSNIVILENETKEHQVFITDAIGRKVKEIIYTEKYDPKISISTLKSLPIDFSSFNASVTVLNIYQPKYFWSNGDTSVSTTFLRPKEAKYYSVTVTDKYGIALRDSVFVQLDKNKYFNTSLITNLYRFEYFYIQKNPVFQKAFWNYRVEVKGNIVKSDSGSTYYNYNWVNFVNPSTTDSAKIIFNCKTDKNGNTVFDTTIIVFLAPSVPPPPNILSTSGQNNLLFCKMLDSVPIFVKHYYGQPPFFYKWSNGVSGFDKSSINIKTNVSTYYKVTVTDALNNYIIDSIKVTIGEKLNLTSISKQKDTVCSNNIQWYIQSDPSIYFRNNLIVDIFLYDPSGKLYRTINNYVSPNYSYNVLKFNYINKSSGIEKVVVNVRVDDSKYCSDNGMFERKDSVWVYPSPLTNTVLEFKNRTICEGDVYQFDNPITNFPKNAVPNLEFVDIIKSIDSWSAYVLNESKDKYKFYLANDDFNGYVNEYTLRLYYGLVDTITGCSNVDSNYTNLNIIKKPVTNILNKYQTINSGNEIFPIYSYAATWLFSATSLSGTLFKATEFPLVGNLENKSSKANILKIAITAHNDECYGNADTAYITVNPKVLESIEILTSSDEFFQGKVKPIKDDLGIPLTFDCYPNPTNSQLTVNYVSDKALATEVSIFSLSGAKLVEYQFETNKGLNQMELDVKKLISGTYILHLRNEDHVKTVKFTKE